MKNKKGFTLVEVIAVIIIIGILMLIAVPNVTGYIRTSRNATYSADVLAFIETIKSKYEMREYGPLLDDNEIMIVPIKSVTFEKGSESESPFGKYDYNRSYIIIVPENQKYSFYATVIDDKKIGMVFEKDSTISEKSIQEGINKDLPKISSLELPGAKYILNEVEYEQIEARQIKGNDVKDETVRVYVFQQVGTGITYEPIVNTNNIYTITLDNQGANTIGTERLYEKYATGWYSDSNCENLISKITKPAKTGSTFLGYYTEGAGQGEMIITSDGSIVTGKESTFSSDGILYANWNTSTPVKPAATCPTTTAYDGTYDGQAHGITVSGGSGGTIYYSTNNSTWRTTNPKRTNVGSQVTYVKVVGDSNHTDKNCSSRIITINKATPSFIATENNKNLEVGVSDTFGVVAYTIGGTLNWWSDDESITKIAGYVKNLTTINKSSGGTNNQFILTVKGYKKGSSFVNVKFTPSDTTNYNTVTLKVSVNVSQTCAFVYGDKCYIYAGASPGSANVNGIGNYEWDCLGNAQTQITPTGHCTDSYGAGAVAKGWEYEDWYIDGVRVAHCNCYKPKNN